MNLIGYLLDTVLGFSLLWVLLLHILIVILFGIWMLWQRRPVAVVFAWFSIVILFPVMGVCLYIVIGERPVGRNLTQKINRFYEEYKIIASNLRSRYLNDRDALAAQGRALSILAESHNGSPVVAGNKIDLFTNSLDILQEFIKEINAAKKTLNLEFYIWSLGGDADLVGEALIAASQRGVQCRVLLDSLGSKSWFKSSWPKRFKAAGIQVTEALPIQFGRFQFRREDLRLHRKIFIVDQVTVWTGSMNMVDPRTFKQDSGVGEWVDAMVRIEGPVAAEFEMTFAFDWSVGNPRIEHFQDPLLTPAAPAGNVLAQEFSSGPVYRDDILYEVLLTAIMDANDELMITTPYFGPDDGLLQAMMSAARRGVKVILVVPKRNDSTLVAWSSRSFYGDLLAAGVNIAEFHGGLLHTKSLLIDKRIAVFGSVNFDQRSLRLNFEISLIVYDDNFCNELNRLIQSYLSESQMVDPEALKRQPRWRIVLENAAHLVSPLL
jgi:cardiolipin synthase A/B